MITGSYLEARQNGNLGGSWVNVKESSICKSAGQIGVFTATGPFAEKTPITWYTAYLRRAEAVGKNNAFIMEGRKSRNGGTLVLVGVRQLLRLHGRGVAQLANDALCTRLTGLCNNCDFIQSDDVVYLVTNREISNDEELLVHYGWSYWSEQRCVTLPSRHQSVMRQHRALAAALLESYGIVVGNCHHGHDEDSEFGILVEAPFDIISFDVVSFATIEGGDGDGNGNMFKCPVTGTLHDRPEFTMSCTITSQEVAQSSANATDDSRFLDYFYVCSLCMQKCSTPFLHQEESF